MSMGLLAIGQLSVVRCSCRALSGLGNYGSLFLGVLIGRVLAFWGLFWGPPIYGNLDSLPRDIEAPPTPFTMNTEYPKFATMLVAERN